MKIEAFLLKHGHPIKGEVGEIAAVTPWVVIHHAQAYEARERNFEILYTAYLNGNIDEGQVSMFLGRMYRMKNGEDFRMKGTHSSEDEINRMIEELSLRERKARAKHSSRSYEPH